MSDASRSTRRAARLLGAAFLAVLCFWLGSISSVATLLELDAGRREQTWKTPPYSPWHWQLGRADAVVWPGSNGFERDLAARSGALSGTLPEGSADLSLALQGERIDPVLLSGARLRIEAAQPVRIALIGQTGSDASLLGMVDSHAAAGDVHIPTQTGTRRPLDVLRLRLETRPGTHVTLGPLSLLVADGTHPGDCDSQDDIAALLERCASRVARLQPQGFRRPEALLHWRDRLLHERPAAVVLPPAVWATWTAPVQWLDARAGGWPFWLLASLPLFGALLSHVGRGGGAARATAELLLIFGPWLLLSWCGWPRGDTEAAAMAVFASAMAAALLARDPRPDWGWLGSRNAWRAALWMLVPAALLIGAAAVANTLDRDGFAPRPFGSDHAWRYPFWALLQQWVLIRAIAPRMRRICADDAAAAVGAGFLFALLHLPNFGLMLLTFVAGAVWAWLGLRHRALLPLVLTHAALGLSLFTVVPPTLVRSAEIGSRFLMLP